jgi:hypothetical protein
MGEKEEIQKPGEPQRQLALCRMLAPGARQGKRKTLGYYDKVGSAVGQIDRSRLPVQVRSTSL